MKTHKIKSVSTYTLYRDLLLFLSTLIDTNLGNIFRKIEYSLSSRTLLYKDFDASLKLPSLLLSISTLNFEIDKRNSLRDVTNLVDSVYSVPLLYDEDKDIVIYGKISEFNLNVTATIVAESALSALEIANSLNFIFPPNTVIPLTDSFITYVPVSEDLLSNMDLNQDNIYYLFIKPDKITGKDTRYYGIFYPPVYLYPQGIQEQPDKVNTTNSINLSFTIKLAYPTYLVNASLDYGVIENISIICSLNCEIPPLPLFKYSNIAEGYIDKDKYVLYRGYMINNNNLDYYNKDLGIVRFFVEDIYIDKDKEFNQNYFVKLFTNPITNKYINTITDSDYFKFVSFDSGKNRAVFEIDTNKIEDKKIKETILNTLTKKSSNYLELLIYKKDKSG